MKRYTTNKRNFVGNIFNTNKKYKERIAQLKREGNFEKLEIVERKYSEFKKSLARVSAIFAISALALTGSVVGLTQSIKEANLNEDIKKGCYIVSDYSKEAFQNSSSNEYNAESFEKNPEKIAQLALNVLKTKIADRLNIDDFSKISILDNSKDVVAGKFYGESGHIENVSLCVDGKTLCSRESFFSSSNGETRVYSNTMPQEILDVIKAISNSQGEDANIKKSSAALDAALNLELYDVSLPEYIENSELER